MRGEHLISLIALMRDWGSSPHARGARARPARRTTCPRDHPRMRGEHRLACSMPIERQGSSPHARGAPSFVLLEPLARGIIPACAGSTDAHRGEDDWPWDHPRMRGEHPTSSLSVLRLPGSSPHARGARPRGNPLRPAQGIIPACAGSTILWCSLHRHTKGSSPHARGALARALVRARALGIIPACAGSTLEYLRLCPGLKRITLTLPITSEAGKWTEKHPNDQLMPRAFRPSR